MYEAGIASMAGVFRRVPCLTVGVVAISVAFTGNVAAEGLPGHPLLVNRPGLRVYGPAQRADAVCIKVLALPPNSLATVKRAVELAMPPFESRLKLDGRNARVRVATALRSGFSSRAGGCGRAAWVRSIVAFVSLPHVHSASLSQHIFAVGRVPAGWVLWAVIH
jgi:hypothetical protein